MTKQSKASCLNQLKARLKALRGRKPKGGRLPDHFALLEAELPTLTILSTHRGHHGFFGQETLRFYSLAGTLMRARSFKLDLTATVDERYITHVIVRSLIEAFFQLVYLYDDPAQTAYRWDIFKNGFKKEYNKLLSEPQLRKAALQPAQTLDPALPPALDVKSMLAQMRNNHGNKLDYLYVIYRITSFDIHGKNLSALLEDVFGHPVNFPILNIAYAIDLIANQYLVTLQDLRARGVV